jgi:hypothetical protein
MAVMGRGSNGRICNSARIALLRRQITGCGHENQTKGRALPHLAFELDASTDGIHDSLTHRKTEARSDSNRLRRDEGLEYSLTHVRGNARSGIGHLDHRPSLCIHMRGERDRVARDIPWFDALSRILQETDRCSSIS